MKPTAWFYYINKNSFCESIYINVKTGKTVITKTNSYRFLGIIINRNIKLSEHIDTIKTKLQKH